MARTVIVKRGLRQSARAADHSCEARIIAPSAYMRG
jgi:hypothetical protein